VEVVVWAIILFVVMAEEISLPSNTTVSSSRRHGDICFVK